MSSSDINLTNASDDPCHLSTQELAGAVPPDPIVEEAVRLAKGFSDPTRLRILALLRLGDVCVHQIVEALGMEQSAVSHQLRTLRATRLVSYTKRGRHVYYRLADEHVLVMLEGILSHSRED